MKRISFLIAVLISAGLLIAPAAFSSADSKDTQKEYNQGKDQTKDYNQNKDQSKQYNQNKDQSKAQSQDQTKAHGQKMAEQQEKKAGQMQTQNLMQVDHLIGTNIYNGKNEQIGEIEKVLVDVKRGKLAYVIMTSGGVLGVGEERYVVPFKALQNQKRDDAGLMNTTVGDEPGIHQVTFNLDKKKDQLKEVPEGNVEELLSQEKQGQEIHDFYGVSPYWDDRDM